MKGSEEVFQNNIIKAPNTRDPDNPYAMVPVERKFKVRIHRFFKVSPEIRPRLYLMPENCPSLYLMPEIRPRLYLMPEIRPRPYLMPEIRPRLYLIPERCPRLYLMPEIRPRLYLILIKSGDGLEVNSLYEINMKSVRITRHFFMKSL